MTPDDQLESILSALHRRFHEGRLGSIRAAQQALGFNVNFFCSQRKRKSGVSLEVVLNTLEFLGVEPLELLAEALEPTTDTIALARKEVDFSGQEAPLLVRQIPKRLAGEPADPSGELCDARFLEQLDELRYEDARLARDQALAAVGEVPHTLLPQLLGVYGSCLRMLENYGGARHALVAALELAQAQGNALDLADLWLRLANLVADLGNHSQALRLCRRATRISSLAEDPIGVGKAFLNEGLWLHYLGYPGEAIALGKAALVRLPFRPAVARFRVAALQHLAASYLRLGDLAEATHYAREAREAAAGAPPWIRGGILWLEARIRREEGDAAAAEAGFRQVVATFAPISAIDTALASVELIRVLHSLGKRDEAYETAKTMARLVEPLRQKSRLFEATLLDLIRCGLERRGLTEELLQQTTASIEEAAAHHKGRAAGQEASRLSTRLDERPGGRRVSRPRGGRGGGEPRHASVHRSSSGPGARGSAESRAGALPGLQPTALPGARGGALASCTEPRENLWHVEKAERTSPEAQLGRCLATLKAHYRRAGHGAIRRVARAVGVAESYFRTQVARRRLDLGFLLRALDVLGIEPLDFFSQALGPARHPVLAFRWETEAIGGDSPPFLGRVRASLAGEAVSAREPLRDACFVEQLDELRYEDARLARDQAMAVVAEVPHELLPKLLGVYGSCSRMLEDHAGARRTLAAALELARARGDPQALADLWLRVANLVADLGNYPRALQLSRRATRIFTLAEDSVGMGEALLNESLWLHYLGGLEEALALGKAALARLPPVPAMARLRVAALQQLAASSLGLGDLDRAIGYAREAREAAGAAPPWIRGGLLWLEAKIYLEKGDLNAAEESFREVVALFGPISAIDSALASVELIRTLRSQGKDDEAYETAKTMVRLVEPLRQKSLLFEAALQEIVRCGLARKGLTEDLLEQLASELEKFHAASSPSWRSDRASPRSQ